MPRSNFNSLKTVLNQMVDEYQLRSKLNEVTIVSSWETVVGKVVNKYTEKIYMKGDKLVVHIPSSVVKQELGFQKERVIKELNKIAGKEAIKEIRMY